MSKNLIRFSQLPVGAIFKRYNVIYKKTNHTGEMQGKHCRDYRDNCVRVENGKTEKIQGSTLVEVISYDNETKN